jgi:hypothetical protein
VLPTTTYASDSAIVLLSTTPLIAVPGLLASTASAILSAASTSIGNSSSSRRASIAGGAVTRPIGQEVIERITLREGLYRIPSLIEYIGFTTGSAKSLVDR